MPQVAEAIESVAAESIKRQAISRRPSARLSSVDRRGAFQRAVCTACPPDIVSSWRMVSTMVATIWSSPITVFDIKW